MTGNMDAHIRALDCSKNVPIPESLVNDPYGTGIAPSYIVRFEGYCLIELRKPESALPKLSEALTTFDPTSTLRRSYLLANLGRVHAQLGDVKAACKQLFVSLDITEQMKSLFTLKRVYQGRAELEPWKKSSDVKELDARIVEVYKSLAQVKERV